MKLPIWWYEKCERYMIILYINWIGVKLIYLLLLSYNIGLSVCSLYTISSCFISMPVNLFLRDCFTGSEAIGRCMCEVAYTYVPTILFCRWDSWHGHWVYVHSEVIIITKCVDIQGKSPWVTCSKTICTCSTILRKCGQVVFCGCGFYCNYNTISVVDANVKSSI